MIPIFHRVMPEPDTLDESTHARLLLLRERARVCPEAELTGAEFNRWRYARWLADHGHISETIGENSYVYD